MWTRQIRAALRPPVFESLEVDLLLPTSSVLVGHISFVQLCRLFPFFPVVRQHTLLDL